MCEEPEVVLRRIARILQFALKCTFPDQLNKTLDDEDIQFINALQINETIGFASIQAQGPKASQAENNETSLFNNGVEDEGGEYKNINTLGRLEIIKVVVLVSVISIILLTTCRMVFQLFLRFRPEKHH